MGKYWEGKWEMDYSFRNKILSIALILVIAISSAIGYYAYKTQKEYNVAQINHYNESFGNLVNYMNSVESLLAKSMISRSPEHSARNSN